MPLFAGLTIDELVVLAGQLKERTVDAGTAFVEHGTEGTSIFAITEGSVRVERPDPAGVHVMAELGVGDFFGEMALVAKVPRIASVIARERTSVVELSSDRLRALASLNPRIEHFLLLQYRERLLHILVELSPVLAALDGPARRGFVEHAGIGVVELGATIVKQGAPSDGLHVVLRGRFAVSGVERGAEVHYPELGAGDVFGEISLVHGSDATATVTAVEPSILIGLHRKHFDEVVLSNKVARERLLALVEERLARTFDLALEVAAKDKLSASVL